MYYNLQVCDQANMPNSVFLFPLFFLIIPSSGFIVGRILDMIIKIYKSKLTT